jgi:hypothetical protein
MSSAALVAKCEWHGFLRRLSAVAEASEVLRVGWGPLRGPLLRLFFEYKVVHPRHLAPAHVGQMRTNLCSGFVRFVYVFGRKMGCLFAVVGVLLLLSAANAHRHGRQRSCERRPNIVAVVLDDLGVSNVGFSAR